MEMFNNIYIQILKLGGIQTKVLDNESITYIGACGLEWRLVK